MVGLLFTIIAFLSDFIFYVGYRHITEELYKPATFGAYVLCFIASLIVGKRLQNEEKQKTISTLEWVIAGLLAIIFIDITFYVVQFW